MKQTAKLGALLLAGLVLLLTLTACADHSEEPVGSCGPYEILYEELRYHTMTYREEHPDCSEEELQAAVRQELAEQYAILELAAEYLPNQSIDSESMVTLVDQALEGAKESLGGKSALKDYLKENYLTEHLLRRLLAITQMQIDLETRLFAGTELESEETLLAWLDEGNYVRVRRIYFPLTDANGNSMREQAEELRAALMDDRNADPDDLISAEQAAAGAVCYQSEFLFRNMGDELLTEAAFRLWQVGDVSNVLEAADGYYLLVRVEDDREALENYQLPTVLDRYRSDRFDEWIAEAAGTLEVTWNEFGSGLLLTELK